MSTPTLEVRVSALEKALRENARDVRAKRIVEHENARDIQNVISAVDAGFTTVDARMDELESSMHRRFDAVDERLNALGAEIVSVGNQLDKKITVLGEAVQQVLTEIQRIK